MTIGDRVKLHIHAGHKAALGLPETVGTLQALDASSGAASVLIHFETMSVFVSPIAGDEIEVLPQTEADISRP